MSDAAFSVRRDPRQPFTILPNLDQLGFADCHAIGVFFALARHANSGSGACYPTHARIREKCGIGETKLKEILKSLRDAGLISWTHEIKGKQIIRTDYQIHWWSPTPPSPGDPPARREPTNPPSPCDAPPVASRLENKNQLTRSKKQELERTSSAAPNPAPTPEKKERKNKQKLIEQWLDETPDQFKQHRTKLQKWLEVRWDKKPRNRDSPWGDGCKSVHGLTFARDNGVIEEFLDCSFADNAGWISFGFPGFVDCVQRLARDKQRLSGSSSQAASDSDQMAGGIPKSLRYVNCAKVVNCPFPIQNGREWLQFDHINPNTPRLWDFFKQVQPYLQVVDRYSREFHARVAWAEQVAAERQGVPA